MHNHGPWGGWDDVNFGRWWAHLPYNHAFGANLVSDFFEQENLTFSQWLAWLRRWMWALDKRMGQIDNRIISLEDRQLVTEDTPSVSWETEGAWEVPTMTWDPQLNQMTWDFPENILTKRANVELSEIVKEIELIDIENSKTWKYQAENATEIEPDGVYTADDSNALNYLYNQVNNLWNEVEDQGESTGTKHLAADMSVGNFSSVSTLAINTPYVSTTSGVNNIFFDVASGYYFVSISKDNHLYIFNKAGDFITRVVLNLLAGHAITSISNMFITFDDKIKGWHIEIGCTNEVAFLFDLLKADVDKASTKTNKDVPITEYNSMETFYTIIGSDNTWLKDSDFMQQMVTVWNTKTGAFATTNRLNWYNAGPVDILVQTSKFIGETAKASADMYGRILATTGGKSLEMYIVEEPEKDPKAAASTKKLEMNLVSTINASTMEVATNKASDGPRYVEGTASPVRNVIALQVVNQAKRQNFRDSEFTVLALQTPLITGNVNNPVPVYEVLALSNSTSSIKTILQNGTISGSSEKHIDNYANANGLAGISFKGTFRISGGSTTFDPVDAPSKQTNLAEILKDYSVNTEQVLENSAMTNFSFVQRLTYHRTGDTTNSPFTRDVPVTLERTIRLTVGSNSGYTGQWVVLDPQWITDNIGRLADTDVGNHLSLSADKNTLTLTRKKLDGTTVASDNVNVQLGDIWEFIGNFQGGDIETTEQVWSGNLAEGGALPVTLTTGTYDIGVHSNDIGAYVIRIIWSSESPINHNSIMTPYVPANSDGSFWIMQPKLTNATNPVFRVTMVKYDHSTQSSSVSNSNNGCQLTSVKRVVVKHIG